MRKLLKSSLALVAVAMLLAALAYPADRAYADELIDDDCGAGEQLCRVNRFCVPNLWGNGCIYERTSHEYYKTPPPVCEPPDQTDGDEGDAGDSDGWDGDCQTDGGSEA